MERVFKFFCFIGLLHSILHKKNFKNGIPLKKCIFSQINRTGSPKSTIMRTGKIPFIANLALTLVSLIALGYLLVLGQSIIAPFFFAFLLAMLFRPLAQFLEEKLRFPRLISTFTCVLIIITLLVGLSFFFSSELSDFSKDIPHLKDQ